MYARLSPETVSFINRGVGRNSESNYRAALNRYAEEITYAIKEVCLELSKEEILDNDWTISTNDEDEVDEQLQFTISERHSRNFFKFTIDHDFHCTWSYHCPHRNSSNAESLSSTNPALKRYFTFYSAVDEGMIIESTFSKRQLVSRYLVDYIIHLSRQLAPVMDQLSDPIHAVAA